MKRTFWIGLLVAAACAGPGAEKSQVPDSSPTRAVAASPETPGSPGVRNAHSMAYDEARGLTIVFGGADEEKVLGETWGWDGESWQRLAEGGPEPRTFASMAYDSTREQVLLFGGNQVLFGSGDELGTFLADTWILEAEGWRQVEAQEAPKPRAEAAMAYDPVHDRVVLFGGYQADGGRLHRFADTWEWDGETWREVGTDGPGAGNGASMAYQHDPGRLILFGGTGSQGKTWEWGGSSWHEVGEEAPGRYNVAMAGEQERGTILRFGGWDGTSRLGDTWELTGGGWEQLEGVGPEGRNHSGLVFDARRDRFVLFGGHDGTRVFGDLWEWDGERWLERVAEEPRLREDNGH